MDQTDAIADEQVCSVCLKPCAPETMIQLTGKWVCENCKPTFVQMMREGASLADITVARCKRLLVMGKKATLPSRCIKCNAPAAGKPLRRKLFWHHPALYVLLLANLLIYALVAILVRKRATVEVSLCEKHLSRRRGTIWMAWALFVGGVVAMSAGIANANDMVFLFPTGLLLLVGSLLLGSIASSLVAVRRIDSEYVWLSRVGREYLDSLPEWVDPR